MRSTSLLIALFAIGGLASANCVLPDDYNKAEATASGGEGGQFVCDDPIQDVCGSVLPTEYGGAGETRVQDMAFVDGSVASVGTFTGTVDFGGDQLSAGGERRGFLVEHDATASVVAQIEIPEAVAGSELRVTYNTFADQIAVGGTYGPGSSCPGTSGLFIRLFDVDMNLGRFVDAYAPVCIEADATTLDVGGIALSNAGWIGLVGTVDGDITGVGMSDGVDGYIINIDPAGPSMPDIFLVGGSGDAAIRGILPNETDTNQWLLAGDFSGELDIRFPIDGGGVKSDTRIAVGERELFIAAIDRRMDDSNLVVRSMGAAGGNHRLISLTSDPDVIGQMHLAARIDGALDVGAPGGTISSATEETAMVLSFIAPDDDLANYTYLEHLTLSAERMDLRGLEGMSGGYHVAGHARGEITITHADGSPDSVPTSGCLEDAFILTITPSIQSTSGQRCGDGAQQLDAIARFTDTRFAATLGVPPGGSINFADGAETPTTGRTYLLRQP